MCLRVSNCFVNLKKNTCFVHPVAPKLVLLFLVAVTVGYVVAICCSALNFSTLNGAVTMMLFVHLLVFRGRFYFIFFSIVDHSSIEYIFKF